ncbi:MAG: efflux RND transporter periplasmic adaptor subunit [bacterium]|nr:efflux RND transporter periplasmic adaptor subunit [bacterium]
MKPVRLITLLTALVLIAVACNKEESVKDLMAKRTELDNQMRDLDAKIKVLEAKQDTTGQAAKRQPVSVVTTSLQTFDHVINVKGSVDSRSSVQITSKMAGTIIRLNVTNGQSVRKGQLLAELDAEITKRAMEEVQTQLDFAVTLFEKQKRIYEAKAGSEVQYLQAKNQKESLERRMESMKEQLSMSRIVSPVSGYADRVMPKVGENVAPGMPMMTIVNTSNLRVVVDLAESYVSTVQSGDPVTLIFTDINDTVRTKIGVVSRSVDAMNRSFRVEIPINGSMENVRPNTTLAVFINDQTIRSAIVLPIPAVLDAGTEHYVYVVEKNVAKRRTVKTGLTSEGNVQIVSGLNAGEQVVVSGVLDVADGQLIQIAQ